MWQTVPAAMLFFYGCHGNLSEPIGHTRSTTEDLDLTSIYFKPVRVSDMEANLMVFLPLEIGDCS
jgi:hypothetical protein